MCAGVSAAGLLVRKRGVEFKVSWIFGVSQFLNKPPLNVAYTFADANMSVTSATEVETPELHSLFFQLVTRLDFLCVRDHQAGVLLDVEAGVWLHTRDIVIISFLGGRVRIVRSAVTLPKTLHLTHSLSGAGHVLRVNTALQATFRGKYPVEH